jgi:hypothetical protein
MGDLKNHKVIIAKGFLFAFLGCLASVVLLLRAPSFFNALLLCVAIWAFCRFYYFAFYVIQNYVDPQFRFSGLLAFLHYLLQRARKLPDRS